MKKKNGFTLIELLAVIVILAIIALIATPIVLNLIEKARKGATQDSAYGVRKAAQLYYQKSLIDSPNGLSSDVTVSFNNGVVTLTNGVEDNNFELDGTKPSSGSITITKDGEVYGTIIINGYTCEVPNAGKVDCTKGSSSNTPAQSASVIITDKSVTNVEVGNTLTLTVTASNTGDAITWTSSNTSVATVENGVVTPVSAGTTIITATAGGTSDTIELTITVPSSAIATCPGCQFIYTTATYAIAESPSASEYSSDMPVGTTTDYTTLGEHPYFLGIIESETTPGKIGRVFACGVNNGTVFCLEGYDTSKFDSNVSTLNAVIPGCDASSEFDETGCRDESSSIGASLFSYGVVDVNDDYGFCYVDSEGFFECFGD